MRCTRVKILVPLLAALTLSLVSTARATAEEAGRLRILFVIDTNAHEIGPNMKVNYDKLVNVIGQLRAGREDRITWDVYEGKNATPANVLSYYREWLKDVRPTDSLLCYYAGHGGWDRARERSGDEKGHYLAMSTGTLYRSQLRQAMLARNPYGVFIFSDCCSNIAGIDPPRLAASGQGFALPHWETFRDLFFLHRGVVDIQAATRGEFCWSNNLGGLFTGALTDLLCQPRTSFTSNGADGFVSWKAFYAKLQQGTLDRFHQLQRNLEAGGAPRRKDAQGRSQDIRDFRGQTPQALYLGEWPATERFLRITNRTGENLQVRLWCYSYDAQTRQWQWYGGDQGFLVEVAPGQTLYAKVNKWWVKANAIKFVASTPTKKWEAFRQQPAYLTPPGGFALSSGMNTWTLTVP
jgi:hypothetical protein